MRKVFPVLLCVGLMLAMTTTAMAADLTRCIEATCRIRTGNSIGTGCVFAIHEGGVYVLTNAHVVGDNQTVTCEFWQAGHISRPLTGRVTSVTTEADAAVVLIQESVFGGRVPPAIPLANSGRRLSSGETVFSVGCAGGAWATSFTGHIKADTGEVLTFVPAPRDGRSGSAIFAADGSCIVGLLRARNEEAREGIACTISRVVRFLRIGVARVAQRVAGCPDGQCPTNRFPRLFRDQPQPNQNPYPTLPAPAPQQVYPTLPLPVPVSPTVDLSGVENKLDKLEASISQLIEELRAANPPPVVEVIPPPVVPVVPVAPVVVAPPIVTPPPAEPVMLGPVPADAIAAAVETALNRAMDTEGSVFTKGKAGLGEAILEEAETGDITDPIIIALTVGLPFGLGWILPKLWRFIRRRFMPSFVDTFGDDDDTPLMAKIKDGMAKNANGGNAGPAPLPEATPA